LGYVKGEEAEYSRDGKGLGNETQQITGPRRDQCGQ